PVAARSFPRSGVPAAPTLRARRTRRLSTPRRSPRTHRPCPPPRRWHPGRARRVCDGDVLPVIPLRQSAVLPVIPLRQSAAALLHNSHVRNYRVDELLGTPDLTAVYLDRP